MKFNIFDSIYIFIFCFYLKINTNFHILTIFLFFNDNIDNLVGPDKVFSLVLKFGESTIYNPLHSVQLPYLTRAQSWKQLPNRDVVPEPGNFFFNYFYFIFLIFYLQKDFHLFIK